MTEREILDDKYALVRRVGTGPNGEVYEAEHLLLGKRVSIKRLKPGLASDGSVRADLLESLREVARIDHPNLASLFDIGTSGTSTFTVSEMLEGRSLLDEVRDRGPLSVAEATDFIVQVLAALDFAHARGAVHGALHANNVLVVYPRPGVPWVKVTDLGLRSALPSHCAWRPPKAELGAFLAPPVRKAATSCTPSDDLYSAAALLHTLLYGKPPGASGDSEPPGNLPKELVQLIRDSLSEDPERRPHSAQDFMSRLTPFALQLPAGLPRGSLPPSLRWFEEQPGPYAVHIRSSLPRADSEDPEEPRDAAVTDSLLRNPRFPSGPDSGWGERLRSVKARYERKNGLGAAWVFAIASVLAGVACALIAAALNWTASPEEPTGPDRSPEAHQGSGD